MVLMLRDVSGLAGAWTICFGLEGFRAQPSEFPGICRSMEGRCWVLDFEYRRVVTLALNRTPCSFPTMHAYLGGLRGALHGKGQLLLLNGKIHQLAADPNHFSSYRGSFLVFTRFTVGCAAHATHTRCTLSRGAACVCERVGVFVGRAPRRPP